MEKKRLPGHVAHSPSARGGSSGDDLRGYRAISEGSLGLGHAAQPEAPGKLSLAGLAAHSGLTGGIRDSPGVSLGTRGGSEGSRR